VTESGLMSGADAAAYCGVTAATFARWISDGRVPKPLPGTRRWDRKAIDLALDRLSGISPAAEQEDAWVEWERKYDARKMEK
jgi:hypothetical protein